ncbi:MAG: glycosyl hydrolase [Firmicutes bacterium]|nr:glycosyl hydrolase [Bacillota bacterium]
MKKAFKTAKPLYRDPIFDGASDPTVIFNRQENNWWMFYTQRRATAFVAGASNVHGTEIGVAISYDNGRHWIYEGVLDSLHIERGHNTFWAPEIVYDGKRFYYMYVSYIHGVPHEFGLSKRLKNGIACYVSENLWDWTFVSFIHHDKLTAIDACVHPRMEGGYRMWFRNDKIKKGQIFCSDSDDLLAWREPFLALDDIPAEGPNVFFFRGCYWLITDPIMGNSKGLLVYRSSDLESWEKTDRILNEIGNGCLDEGYGRHADVVVCGERAFIFYFTQPYRRYHVAQNSYEFINADEARCVVQAAELEAKDGRLICDRNKDFDLFLNSVKE